MRRLRHKKLACSKPCYYQMAEWGLECKELASGAWDFDPLHYTTARMKHILLEV